LKVGVGLVSLLVLAAGGLVVAGPLRPAAGPVASTCKTLQEIEPRIAVNATNTPGNATSLYRITQPGSYYLTGNIQGESGKSGIRISASGVTLDLNGFTVAGAAGTGDGIIDHSGSDRGVAIRNGTVSGWGGNGISLGDDHQSADALPGTHIENVVASGNGWYGFDLGGASMINHCSALSNGLSGFISVRSCMFTDCTSKSNGHSGFLAGASSVITGCSAMFNEESGFAAAEGSVLSHCTANSNTGDGLSITGGVLVEHCAARYNKGAGIDAQGLLAKPMIIDNSCEYNSGHNILVQNRALIRGNRCELQANTVDNIRILGDECRVENNYCTGGQFGIFIITSGSNNVVTGNTAIGTTSGFAWFTPNNVVGPVVTAKGTIASTSPFANFQY